MIKIMISSTVQPSSWLPWSAGVCTGRNSSHLHSLYLPLPLRVSASCSNLHPHIVDGFLENFPDQVVSPMAGGLLLGLWIHLWRGVATIYAGDPSSMIHHHHHCHNHRISVDIEVVFASGVLMMMYSNVLGFNWFLILLTYCAIDPNLTLLDSKRHRKPWVVRSVGGKSANGHLSSGPGRVGQQPRVFASIESSSKGGDRRMSTDESSRRWERPNILCKSWSSKSYLWQKLLLLEPAKRMTNISSRTVKHFGASFGIIFPTKNPVWHFT